MVSKEAGKCALTNSESDSEAAPSLALEMKYSLDPSRQVRKRNKALQVRFKDICEAQNEQREAARQGGGGGKVSRPVSHKAAYRKYMTVPARRSIPNVTRSTGVQTSPDLKKRYQTFPFERKKGHSLKHPASVEPFKAHGNGFAEEPPGSRSHQVLLHTATVEPVPGTNCADGLASPDSPLGLPDAPDCQTPPPKGLQPKEDTDHDAHPSAKRQLLNLNFKELPTKPSQDAGSKVTGPIAWNSLTQVECLESATVRNKRKKGLQVNGLQSQTLPRTGCSSQAQCHPARTPPAPRACPRGEAQGDSTCQQVVPLTRDGDLKAQLQVMENLISSSQETIKVLLGVIQELEKGEAHREGLSYRTGQDTANCDTCRNSACIIYSVELDFKQQEDKLQPLMKKLCPLEDTQLPSLPYPQDTYTSTPKRKSKTESKKHARWKLWFL